jgi:RNA polymerase-binding transcription factor DksA
MAPTPELTARLEAALRARRADLREELARELHGDDGLLELRSHRDETDPEISAPLDAVDMAQAMRDDAEFARIDSALQRLAHGDYGVCSDCGEAIDDARLLAEPTAQRCTACQQRYEHTHR